jgi:hypothetical protein
VLKSTSVRQVLTALGLKEAGGNYFSIKHLIAENEIDSSHFTGQGHLKGKTHSWSVKKPMKDILKRGVKFHTSHLRKRLIAEGYLEDVCSCCGGKDWMGDPLTLHLDHINGDRIDHRMKNLRLLCPNCHSQTDTYCGKNIGK